MKKLFPALMIVCFFYFGCKEKESMTVTTTFTAPAGDQYCYLNDREAIIPNGRLVKPMGKTTRIAPHPYGLFCPKMEAWQ